MPLSKLPEVILDEASSSISVEEIAALIGNAKVLLRQFAVQRILNLLDQETGISEIEFTFDDYLDRVELCLEYDADRGKYYCSTTIPNSASPKAPPGTLKPKEVLRLMDEVEIRLIKEELEQFMGVINRENGSKFLEAVYGDRHAQYQAEISRRGLEGAASAMTTQAKTSKPRL